MKKLLPAAIATLLFIGAAQPGLAATVAIVDTGLDPGVLGGSIVAPGFDFVNNDSEAIDDQPGQHGTSAGVSAVQAAPNVGLIPIKAFGSGFETSTAILNEAFNFVAGQGARATSHNIGSITSTSLGALQAVTNSGSILVIQAGNAAAPGPTGDARQVPNLGGRGIVAGGILGGEIWSASNRAGDLQDHYLVADVRAPINGWVGTSMATPRIAAVAASVAESFPFLSPQQVVQVLFESARDLGSPGVDSTYGHGAVDYNAAIASVGEGSIPSGGGGGTSGGGGGGGGGGAGIAVAALAVGGIVAYSTKNKKEDELKKTIFVDKFGRAFNIDLSSRSTVESNIPVMGLFHARQNPLNVVRMVSSDNAQSIAFFSEPVSINALNYDPYMDDVSRVGFKHSLDHGDVDYVMGLNADLSSEFGAMSLAGGTDTAAEAGRFLYNQIYSTPALGFSSQGSSLRMGWDGDGKSHHLGLAVIDDQEQHGVQSNSILYENRMEKERVKLGFQIGALIEDGSLFGGSSDSAFGADQTSTYYLGLSGAWNLSRDVSLIGGYFQGLSEVDASDISVLDQFSDIRTEGYGFGVLIDNALSPRGSFGLSYSSPMQTTSGSARLTLPTSQNRYTGAIGYETSDVSFEDSDQEKILEAYYGFELTNSSDVFAHFSYTKNPVSEPDMNQNHTVYVGWRKAF
ncbi:MAG: S8 family serine peptidase [bacterium]